MLEHVMESVCQRSARQTSPQARVVLEISDREDWNARVLWRAPIPRSPVRARDWLFVPLEADGSPIPDRALKRVRAMYEAGIRPQGFVIIHEAPPYLKAGTRTMPLPTEPIVDQRTTSATSLITGLAAGALLLIVVPLAAALIVGVLIALATAIVVPVAAVGIASAVLIDPMLVAVTDDGYWIVIDQWWT